MTKSIPQVARREERPPFELTHEPDGRSWTARENLSDILERELLGPANGPDELLNGSPDTAYLVGRIAPARLTAGREDPTTAGDPDAATDVGDAVDADESRGVPVTAVDDSAASADEDSVEDQPQQRGLMIPASMGLRFQIPTDLDAFTVLVTWGTYKSVTDEKSDSSRARKYQRTPMAFPQKVRVGDVRPGRTAEYPLHDKVVLRVDRYDDTERGCRMIEVALCNDKVTPRKIPVDAWLYQTRLTVDAGGTDVFLPVTDAMLDTRDERDDELRRLRLQYRDRLEFALGRTCSVDWAVASKARRATSVWTTWLPTSETPQ
ncbi:MAG: helicase, partial [Tomitella sp.]|nr:helicase [Tomitella sp.]